ncbi:LytTR family DNA-binding domain-containing protein [Flavicella sp.]|nr:LytTR family DNA-binding domain-containing protein [Flavicella sp.]
MKSILIDDEVMALEILKKLCSKVKELEVVATFSNAIDAIKYLNSNQVDLIFLDIHMPDFSGFDFVKTLKNPTNVIVTTSEKDFALEAFEHDFIIDFLVKPLSKSRFIKAIQKTKIQKEIPKLKNDFSEENTLLDVLYANVNRRLIKIDIPSINLVEANGDYINVKTSKKNYVIHSTLKKIENKLPSNLFVKVHRSYLINIKKIVDIQDNSVLIEKEIIPVSRINKPELLRRLNLL